MTHFSLSAVSLAQNTRGEERLKPSNTQDLFLSISFKWHGLFQLPEVFNKLHFESFFSHSVCVVSKCLTLLIEIHPINNTKVLKAVDCRVKVQVGVVCVCVVSATFMQVLLQPRADVAVMDNRGFQCTCARDHLFYRLAESALASSCHSHSYSLCHFLSGSLSQLCFVNNRGKLLMNMFPLLPNHKFKDTLRMFEACIKIWKSANRFLHVVTVKKTII